MKLHRPEAKAFSPISGGALPHVRYNVFYTSDYKCVTPGEWQLLAPGVTKFTPKELADTRTGALLIDVEALRKLQALRDALGVPVKVTSAYRSPTTNEAVGGHPSSAHMAGRAFDIHMPDTGLDVIYAAVQSGFTGIGVRDHGPIAARYMHLDDIARAAGRAFWTYA